uniref:Sushi domain-containing protein n=1 Tax=Ciona savignyi TaxID=51511 RepID=H2Z151_CIOSA
MPTNPQCNGANPSAVCRCCCNNDGCNRGPLTCIPEISCPEQKNVQNGAVVCSNSNRVGSKCRRICKEDYYVYPSGSDVTVCGEKGRWNGTKSCCARMCPPNGFLDIVFVLHTSDAESWRIGKEVIAATQALFTLGNGLARIGFVAAGSSSFETSPIQLIDVTKSDSLAQAIRSQTFTDKGNKDSSPERALQFAKNSMFTQQNGDRAKAANIVVFVTNIADPSADLTSVASAFRDSRIKAFAVDLQDQGTPNDQSQLLKLTRSRDHIFTWRPGYSNRRLSFQIGAALCGNPCEQL